MGERKIDTERCQGIKFRNVTPEIFSCMKKKLERYGMDIQPGNSGVFKGNGIVALFSWDEGANLVIEIKERPLTTYCGQVSGKLKAFMRECQGF